MMSQKPCAVSAALPITRRSGLRSNRNGRPFDRQRVCPESEPGSRSRDRVEDDLSGSDASYDRLQINHLGTYGTAQSS